MFLVVFIFLSLFLVIILSHTSGLGVKGLTRLPYGILRYGIRHKNEKGTYNLKGEDGKPDVASDVLRRLQEYVYPTWKRPSDVRISRRERIIRRVVHKPDVKGTQKKRPLTGSKFTFYFLMNAITGNSVFFLWDNIIRWNMFFISKFTRFQPL